LIACSFVLGRGVSMTTLFFFTSKCNDNPHMSPTFQKN